MLKCEIVTLLLLIIAACCLASLESNNIVDGLENVQETLDEYEGNPANVTSTISRPEIAQKNTIPKGVDKSVSFPSTVAISSSPPLAPPSREKDDEQEGSIPRTDKFWPSFLTAFIMILVSEMGDKTFLIAAIMSMRHSRITIFSSGLSALILMTIISSAFGLLLPNLIPRVYTLWMAALLFLIFGIKMIIEASQMSSTKMKEEYDEVNHEIEDAEVGLSRRPDSTRTGKSSLRTSRQMEAGMPLNSTNQEEGKGEEETERREESTNNLSNQVFLEIIRVARAMKLERLVSPVFIQTFSLTFLAEWGDRSQIATIALAAAQNVYGVTLGAIAGHAICTALAVISGRLLASILSIKTVTMLGGMLFIIFAIFAVL